MTVSMPEDEFTELVNADFPRVDLVGKAANGIHKFLIAKGAEDDGTRGVIEAAVVRDLVAKANAPKENPVTSTAVEKADGEVTVGGDLDAAETFVGDANAVTQPGSPEWETVDADTAAKWVGILARAKNAVAALANRERAEVFAESGDPSDVWDLEDAGCAIDAALSMLAPYAVSEAAEAASAENEGVFKAATMLFEDPFPLTTIEGFDAILKAGRSLSTEVAKQFQGAVVDLGKILSTLPEAPVDVTKAEVATPPVAGTTQAAIVAGENGLDAPALNPEQHGANEGDETQPAANDNVGAASAETSASDNARGGQTPPVSGTTQEAMLGGDTGQATPNDNPQGAPIRKAGPQQAVYDSAGNLLGTVDPSKITELIPEGSGDASTTVEGDATAAEPDAAPVADAATAAPTPQTPEAPAPVAAAPAAETSDDKVEKSAIEQVVKAALEQQAVENAAVLKAMQDRLDHLEAPAQSRVLSHGVIPDSRQLRGLDKEGDRSVDVSKAADLRERLDSATDMDTRSAVEKEMNEAAGAAWAAMRAGQPGGQHLL